MRLTASLQASDGGLTWFSSAAVRRRGTRQQQKQMASAASALGDVGRGGTAPLLLRRCVDVTVA